MSDLSKKFAKCAALIKKGAKLYENNNADAFPQPRYYSDIHTDHGTLQIDSTYVLTEKSGTDIAADGCSMNLGIHTIGPQGSRAYLAIEKGPASHTLSSRKKGGTPKIG